MVEGGDVGPHHIRQRLSHRHSSHRLRESGEREKGIRREGERGGGEGRREGDDGRKIREGEKEDYLWIQEALDRLFSDRNSSTFFGSVRHAHHCHVSNRCMQASHALLLRDQSRHTSVNLQMMINYMYKL